MGVKRVYYREGPQSHLFLGLVCNIGDADLEVAFRKSTCFVRDLQGNDLLTAHNSSIGYASKTPHPNFDYINLIFQRRIFMDMVYQNSNMSRKTKGSSCKLESSARYVEVRQISVTFYQPYQSEHQWTKDYLLSQVHVNPSKLVKTRPQLATDPKMCMFALTVTTAKLKNIKEAMTDSAWIEAMQEELLEY
ncbi:hypothetical protein Tco_0307435 [Tanacetum coccineum]